MWTDTLEKVKSAVVALRVTALRSVEGDQSGLARATGFVVSPGIILTNRHVVGSFGPITASAVFDQHEEIEILPLYRDPIHDFGFFSFDPSRLRFTKHATIPLRPDKLQVGMEIRVIGNDSGEKLQILSATIARVDRNVPKYNSLYQDENTFYVGAASNTSGGSSGSPVIDKVGHCVALNAGGSSIAASSFYLPLDRVKRALDALLKGDEIPRGCLQAAFSHRSFDHCWRNGFPEEEEKLVVQKHPSARGMLEVSTIMPTGVANGILESGDILLDMNGQTIVTFPAYESILDENVGKEISLRIWRYNKSVTVKIRVADFHSLTPSSFVDLADGIFHNVPYCYGKVWNLPLNGVYVSARGFIFGKNVDSYSVILQIDGEDTPDVDAFARIIARVRDKQRFTVLWHCQTQTERTKKMTVCIMERTLCGPPAYWRLENKTHLADKWVKKAIEETTNEKKTIQECQQPLVEEGGSAAVKPGVALTTSLEDGLSPLEQRLPSWATAVLKSLVLVEFRTPLPTGIFDHFMGDSSYGVGVIVCTEGDRVFILTDREAVPQALGIVYLTINGSIKVEARPLFIHPLHNLVLLGVEKSKLPPDMQLVAIDPHPNSIGPGEECYFVGLTKDWEVIAQEVTILSIFSPQYLPTYPPAWREQNIEGLLLCEDLLGAFGGLLCDGEGKSYAMYSQFVLNKSHDVEMAAIPFRGYTTWMWPTPPTFCPSLGIELAEVSLADACSDRGLTAEWSQKLRTGAKNKLQALSVYKIEPHGCSQGVLQEGDMLLSVEKKVCCSYLDVEEALHTWMSSSEDYQRKLEIVVFRQKQECPIRLRPQLLPSDGAEDVIVWNGMIFIRTPKAVIDKGVFSIPPGGGAYCVKTYLGSPGGTYELNYYFVLLSVDETPINSLDDLAQFVRKRDRNASNGLSSPRLKMDEDEPMDASYTSTVALIENNDSDKSDKSDSGIVPIREKNGSSTLEQRGKNARERVASSRQGRKGWLRLLTKDLEGREWQKTLLPNETFYPPYRISKQAGGEFVRECL